MLRAAGVAVTEDVCPDAARTANAGFLSRVLRGRPMLTLKLAMTLDGRIATAAGESRWITGPIARRSVHAMRADHDAVLVGVGTALADDPDLRVRDMGMAHQPVRVIADSTLRLSPGSRLARSIDDAAPVWLLHTDRADTGRVRDWQARGAQCIVCTQDAAGQVDMADAMTRLGAAGLTRVLCEGGGLLAAALLQSGLADRLAVFSAGMLMGGDGRAGVGALGLDLLAKAPRFTLIDQRTVGGDTLQLWQSTG